MKCKKCKTELTKDNRFSFNKCIDCVELKDLAKILLHICRKVDWGSNPVGEL